MVSCPESQHVAACGHNNAFNSFRSLTHLYLAWPVLPQGVHLQYWLNLVSLTTLPDLLSRPENFPLSTSHCLLSLPALIFFWVSLYYFSPATLINLSISFLHQSLILTATLASSYQRYSLCTIQPPVNLELASSICHQVKTSTLSHPLILPEQPSVSNILCFHFTLLTFVVLWFYSAAMFATLCLKYLYITLMTILQNHSLIAKWFGTCWSHGRLTHFPRVKWWSCGHLEPECSLQLFKLWIFLSCDLDSYCRSVDFWCPILKSFVNVLLNLPRIYDYQDVNGWT